MSGNSIFKTIASVVLSISFAAISFTSIANALSHKSPCRNIVDQEIELASNYLQKEIQEPELYCFIGKYVIRGNPVIFFKSNSKIRGHFWRLILSVELDKSSKAVLNVQFNK